MAVKLELITQTREDLFDVATTLAAGIDRDLYADKDSPVVLFLRGSMCSGKKLVADAMRKHLLSSTGLGGFSGSYGYDEYWRGKFNGHPIEVDYIDAAYADSLYMNSRVNNSHNYVYAFMGLRRHGGLSIVQNRSSIPEKCTRGTPVVLNFIVHTDSAEIDGATCRDAFDKAMNGLVKDKLHHGAWLRRVAIETSDERLTVSPAFMKAVAQLKAAGQRIEDKILHENDAADIGRVYSMDGTPQQAPAYKEFFLDSQPLRAMAVRSLRTMKARVAGI